MRRYRFVGCSATLVAVALLIGSCAGSSEDVSAETEARRERAESAEARVAELERQLAEPTAAPEPTYTHQEVFNAVDDHMCEWVSEEDVAEFVASEFDWAGTATEVEPEASAFDCGWELSGGTRWDPGHVWAASPPWEGQYGSPGRLNPDDLTAYDGGRIPIGGWVIGHPALEPGVVLRNGAFGRFYFGVPPDGPLLELVMSVPGHEWRDDDYEARFFAVANHFLEHLGWNPDQ